MGMFKKICLTFLSLLFIFSLKSQDNFKSNDLIQFSGVVISSDSLKPVPYCSIIDIAHIERNHF